LGGGSALAVVVSLCAPQAWAATAGAAATDASGGGVVGELVVVAEKREANIETVPVSVSAFTGKQRDIIGIKTVQDLSDFTPGLSYYAIADRAYIRGIGRNTTNLATESGVATYYNGIYYGANATIALSHDSLFTGQVEVDRGPQNTLHGSNSDGGTINYTSVRPPNEFTVEGRVGGGNYGYVWGEGAMGGPINDHLRFRIGGNYSTQGGGYFNNLDGPREGGSLPQGNSGQSEYLEAQVDWNIGHLDGWTMVSSGDYLTNFHTVAAVGAIPEYEFPSASLGPSTFFGLCGLDGNTGTGCLAPYFNVSGGFQTQTVVPGSGRGGPVLANAFPGNNPADPHQFIETSNQSNDQTSDVAVATTLTYHFPSIDVEYLGGWQAFDYNLFFGPGYDSGLTSYQIQGAANAVAAAPGCAGVFGLTGAALAGCEVGAQAPLTIDPAGAGTSFDEHESYFSHELDFSSTTKGPLQWIGGVYWYHESFDQPVGLGCNPNQTQLINPLGAPQNPGGCYVDLDGNLSYDSVAGFGQGDWKITPQWKLEVGLRYTADHKYGYEQTRFFSFDDPSVLGGALTAPTLGALTPAIDITSGALAGVIGRTFPGAGMPTLNAATGYWQRSLNGTWGALTGNADLDWTPTEDTLAYLKYSRGYKTGGFNAGGLAVNPETAPEFVNAYEIGVKQTVSRTVQVNASAFYYNYQNDQQPFTLSDGATNTLQIVNIPDVRTYGVELEGYWKPIDPLLLSLSYSYLNSKVSNTGGACVEDTQDPLAQLPGANTTGCTQFFTATVHPQTVLGQTLPEAPPNKVAVNGQYTLRFDPGNLTLSATYVWKDGTYGSIFNRAGSLAPAYSQVNLRATWADAKNRYNLIFYVDNVTNAAGFDNVTYTNLAPGAGYPLSIIGATGLIAPLTFGGELQFRFH
jgi:iron complex outermembrane receptor protein